MSNTTLLAYFAGDSMAASNWSDKYQVKDKEGNPLEETPADMHRRLAKEFARIEYNYKTKELSTFSYKIPEGISEYGKKLLLKRTRQSEQDIEDEFFFYFDNFKQIVPQGSIMSNLGNKYIFGSLSNCFGIAPPLDSYAGILRTEEELVQLMKRRGGVGTHLNNLRPVLAPVTNAGKSSTGVPSFAERYSNSTREVAQEGRRGALMLLLSCKHPDIFKFVTMKDDKTKVTGANITTMLTNEFMVAALSDNDFICTFPIGVKYPILLVDTYNGQTIEMVLNPAFHMDEYNKVYEIPNTNSGAISVMKIHAKELFDLIVEMAHKNAEPGVAYIDTIQDYCPDGVYELYKPVLCNPCGEQWFSPDETCRLIAENYFSIVDNPFTNEAKVNLDRLYEMSYMQQRLGDNLVDLEVEYIDRILDKLDRDPEPEDIKRNEINLWSRIRDKAIGGRRTGGGFTALGDMLAALGLPYDNSSETLDIIEIVSKTKMEAELDCTIDMAILRGAFEGWNRLLETQADIQGNLHGQNSFYGMLIEEFPSQMSRMYKYGRRNISWSTVAPTGTVSTMTQTTSGLEPLFKAFYIRRKKINANQEGIRVDFVDQNGDKWQEYAVLHPKFKDWIELHNGWSEGLDKTTIDKLFKASPWCGSEANDISANTRIEIQSIIQKYTSNAISCTVNLPSTISKEIVGDIYIKAWKAGLKGITVYRDGSRTGVLITESINHTTQDKFGYNNSIRRPKKLEGHYHSVYYEGERYAVVIGILDNNPYEVFSYKGTMREHSIEGEIIKISRGNYKFIANGFEIDNLVVESERANEELLTRWVSQMLRHGVNPKYVIEQIEKSNVQVGHFSKVIARVLKKYVLDEVLVGEVCPNCNKHAMIYEEGCKKCSDCGYSKC